MFAACTIVSNNYLPFARVLVRSFRELHPEARFVVLLVDRPIEILDYQDEPFEIVLAEDLAIPAFENFAFRYSILELNTAVKPYFLAHLHEELGISRACYFDPDILIVDRLDDLDQELSASRLLLTPHILEPIDDDKIPSEQDFLLSGIYNLGFLGIRFDSVTMSFLEWWQRRLYSECLHAVDRGLFVDQRWMDFAPAFVEGTQILREPGYNVAYWNLPQRVLGLREGAWRVNGEPLRFFHFSGFDPREPEMISKYQNRYRLRDREDLRPLFQEYRERLLEEGFDQLRELPYAYGEMTDGTLVPEVARVMLRKVDPRGERWPDPFATGEGSFLEWLREPCEMTAPHPIPRIGYGLWEQRVDLQQAFPFPLGRDAEEYGCWLVEQEELVECLGPLAENLPGTHEGGSERRAVSYREHGLGSVAALFPGGKAGGVDLMALVDAQPLDVGERPFLPRLALEIHRLRRDLQRWFPEPMHSHREPFAIWYATHGRLEYRLPRRFVRDVLRTLPLRQRIYAELWWAKQWLRRRALMGETS